jgi:hypothetical protein
VGRSLRAWLAGERERERERERKRTSQTQKGKLKRGWFQRDGLKPWFDYAPFNIQQLCTGAAYAAPIKSAMEAATSVEQRRRQYEDAHAQLAAAATVVVVGGGFVGVELAAEIVGKWGRSKHVTLLCDGGSLVPRLNPQVEPRAPPSSRSTNESIRHKMKMVLERWTNPRRPRCTCTSCEYELPSWRGKSAGVTKWPRERPPTRIPYHTIRTLLHRCTLHTFQHCPQLVQEEVRQHTDVPQQTGGGRWGTRATSG